MTDIPSDALPAKPALSLRAYLAAFVKGDYARGFFRSVALQAFAVIVLIEAIFLAEHFTWVFRDAVRHEAGLFDIVLVLICSGTGIFDLSLAIAVLMAAYATLLRMRENRELLVLFASGLGPYQLSALIGILACAAQVVGVFGSGIVDPFSRYAQRAILFGTELHSLKQGVAQGEFYYFPSYVVYAMERGAPASPTPSGVKDRTLFVYQQIAPQTSRVVTAARAHLEGPDPAGKIMLNLSDFTSHTFADANPLPATVPSGRTAVLPKTDVLNDLKNVPRITMKVRDMSQLMMVDQLIPFGVRGSVAEEKTIFEQFATPHFQPRAERVAQMRLMAERFSRSLLALLAPLLALAAVCLTTRLTNWFALPIACLALMSVNLAGEWLITTIVPVDVAAALLPIVILCAAVAALAFAVIRWRQSDLVRPQLERS